VNVLELPHRDARERVATGAPVFVLVNPPEFHGPHLSLRNDALVSAGLARDLHARLAEGRPEWPFLVAGELEVGCDVTPGPGTVETPFRVVKRLVLGACEAALALGAQRVVLMTFHGGPHQGHALQAGVRWLERRGVRALAPLNIITREMIDTQDGAAYAEAFAHVEDPAERAALVEELPRDFHGGFFETSLSLHYAPATVSPVHKELPPCPPVRPALPMRLAARLARLVGARALARELDFVAVGMGWHALRPFPAYTGRPAHASAASGAFFAKQLLDRYAAVAADVFAGRAPSPRPILGWLPALTLGGRLGGTTIPPREISGR
jgi:creatinine amidohydrolase